MTVRFRCINQICVPNTVGDGGMDSDVPQECQATEHLVLSEVNAGATAVEFIEIANPTANPCLRYMCGERNSALSRIVVAVIQTIQLYAVCTQNQGP